MPGVKAYMLSMLAVRRATLQAEFLTRYPAAWLVWEPGVWQPTSPVAQGPTRISSLDAAAQRPVDGDALCFQLAPGAPLKVGRAPGCDVLVNDATVSREHLWLEPSGNPEGWAARLPPGARTTLLNGQPLPPGAGHSLHSGSTLRLGDVTLTYLGASGLAARLDAQIRSVTSSQR